MDTAAAAAEERRSSRRRTVRCRWAPAAGLGPAPGRRGGGEGARLPAAAADPAAHAARAAHQQGDRGGARAQPRLGAAPRAHPGRHRLPDRAAATPRAARLAGAALPGLGQDLLPRHRGEPIGRRPGPAARDVPRRRSRASSPGLLDSARLGFRLKPEDRERVQRPAPGRCSRRSPRMPSDPEGEPWSLYLGLHPERAPAYRPPMTPTPSTSWTEITDLDALTALRGRAHAARSATRPAHDADRPRRRVAARLAVLRGRDRLGATASATPRPRATPRASWCT